MSEAFQAGFGARLKAGREAKAMKVADVAAKLKLTGRQVEAMEAEDFSHLPSEVFVRGFVRNYARMVDVDVDTLIAPVDAQATVSETITAPSAGVSFASNGIKRWVLLPLAGLAGFVLLVAVLYHWLRQGEDALIVEPAAPAAETIQTLPVQPVVPVPEAAAPAQAVPVPAATPAPDNTASPASPAVVVPAPQVIPAPTVPATAPVSAPVAAKPVAEVTPPAAPVQTGSHVLRFEPGLDAWIQVVDGKGSRFSKLIRAGTSETFAGEPPFRLVVGEAARVRLSYNGHTIDLTPFIGQKVARLTLE